MTHPVREDDLHAYVDGALSDARRIEVEAWLAAHPEDAARVRAWVMQNQALHAAFDGVLNEPLPIDLIRAARRRLFRAPWRAIAAILALAASGLTGYGIGLKAVFSPEARHPVEVDAAHAAHLVSWLSKRVGTPLKAPDFGALGFHLLGGRLLAGDTGAVAQFMYQNAGGQRVTLYVRRAVVANRETAFRHVTEHGIEVFYWIDRDFGYALAGQIAHPDMEKLADAAYRQLTGA
ncbi:MAG: anti-sigma factor [Thiobacillus sp.]|nr:anti-sigma factor [Thiobacillus sp.]